MRRDFQAWLAASAIALGIGAWAPAEAVTVYTYTGTGTSSLFGDGAFEAIFRIDGEVPSFTLTMNGKTLGYDSDYLPIEITGVGGPFLYLFTPGHTSIYGGSGYTYLAMRFGTIGHDLSHIHIEAVDHGRELLAGATLDATSLTITDEPDLPRGYVDISALPPIDSLPASATPEPAAWTLMLLGFGAVGAMIRRGKVPFWRDLATSGA